MTINEIYTILLGILILMPGILGIAVFKYFMNVEFKKEIPFFLFLYTTIEFAAIISGRYANVVLNLDSYHIFLLYSIFGIVYGILVTIFFEETHHSKTK